MTVLILFGSPSTTLLSLSFLTEIISLTNFTVKYNASAVFSKFSIAEDLIPTIKDYFNSRGIPTSEIDVKIPKKVLD